jgi:single-strand DNA-binding protein
MGVDTNTFIATGRLTRDPERRVTNSGKEVASFAIAVNGFKEDVMFLDVETWEKSAKFCMDYLRKGAYVLIDARLRQDTWEDRNTGQKRSKVKAVASRVQSLDKRETGTAGGNSGHYPPATPPQTGYQPPPAPPAPPPLDTPPPSSQQNDEAFDVSEDEAGQVPF